MTLRLKLALPLVAVGALIVLVAACSHGGGSSTAGMGRVSVHLTDAPLDMSNVQSVVVTVSSVTVYPGVEGMGCDDEHGTPTPTPTPGPTPEPTPGVTATGITTLHEGEGDDDQGENDDEGDCGAPIVISTHPETFDLLTLTAGATTLLASGEVPEGFYQRIRIGVSSAVLTYTDGTSVDLKLESHKVDIPISFHVTTGGDAGVVLDFDAAASVQVNETASGQFILRPVVTGKPL